MSAPFSISNCLSVGETITREYFGGDLTIAVTKLITAKCFVSDVSNADGPINVSDLIALRNKEDWAEVTVAGRNYGKCQIVGFSLDPDANATVATCNISLRARSVGTSASGGYYADLLTAIGTEGDLVESISENINLGRSQNSTSYSRTVDLKINNKSAIYNPLLGSPSPVPKAKEIVRKWLSTLTYSFPLISGEYDAILDKDFKTFKSERIDAIQGTVSVTETLDTSNVAGDYAHTFELSLSVGQDGVTTVTESGEIEGLTADRIGAANAAYSSVIAAAKTRCSDLYSKYTTAGVGGVDNAPIVCDKTLKDAPTEQTKTVNTFSGTIEYSVSYSDDSSKIANVYRTISSTVNEEGCVDGGEISYTFEGATGANEATGTYPRYQIALALFLNAQSGLAYVTGTATSVGFLGLPISRTEQHRFYDGVIEGSLAYSNDSIYRFHTTTGLIKKIEFNMSTSDPVPAAQVYQSVPMDGQTSSIVQSSYDTLSGLNYSTRMLAHRISPDNTTRRGQLLALASGLLPEVFADESSVLNSVSYSFSPMNDVEFELDAATEYFTGVEDSCG